MSHNRADCMSGYFIFFPSKPKKIENPEVKETILPTAKEFTLAIGSEIVKIVDVGPEDPEAASVHGWTGDEYFALYFDKGADHKRIIDRIKHSLLSAVDERSYCLYYSEKNAFRDECSISIPMRLLPRINMILDCMQPWRLESVSNKTLR